MPYIFWGLLLILVLFLLYKAIVRRSSARGINKTLDNLPSLTKEQKDFFSHNNKMNYKGKEVENEAAHLFGDILDKKHNN